MKTSRQKSSIVRYHFFLLLLVLPSGSSAETAITDSPAIKYPLVEKSLLLDIESKKGLTVTVGERGHILWTTDHEDWVQADVPTRSTLTALTMIDNQKGWAVGHDAVILMTDDGARSWSKQYFDPALEAPLLDVWFEDEQHGIAIGAYGLYLVTRDGGLNWENTGMNIVSELEHDASEEEHEALYALYDLHYNAITETDDGTLYIAAEAGRIYRSDNSGGEWIELPSPYGGSFFGILPINNSTLLIYGLRGHIYRTEDAGQTWQAIESHTEDLITNGTVLHNRHLILTGMSGTLLMSFDGGHHFSRVSVVERHNYAAVTEVKDRQIILVGDEGIRSYELQELELIDE